MRIHTSASDCPRPPCGWSPASAPTRRWWGAGRHEEFMREHTVDSKPGYSCRSKSHPLCSDVIILIISHVFQIRRSHCEGGWMSSLYWSRDSNLLGRPETLRPGGRAALRRRQQAASLERVANADSGSAPGLHLCDYIWCCIEPHLPPLSYNTKCALSGK